MRHTTIFATSAILSGALAAACFAADRNSKSIQPEKDSQISQTVQAVLAADRDTQNTSITVTTENGVVSLNGAVKTPAQKQRAQRDALSVQGVAGVRNDLALRP